MISFNSVNLDFELQNPLYFKTWFTSVILSEQRTVGEIHFIFCDDEYLLEINKKFLDHETLTDIITFPTTFSDELISGEIYISIPRVIENAEQIKST